MSTPDVSRGTPPPSSAAGVFGTALEAVVAYHDLLASDGVEHGLIGPREVDRLWERHLLNSAVVGEVIPTGTCVLDVGSGAGLPGIPLALARPDLRVVLVEPLLRRASFLSRAVEVLELTDRVTVERRRAQDAAGQLSAAVVTARAVAPLARLAGWCLPLVRPGGTLAAIKGRSVDEELERDRAAVSALGGQAPAVVRCGLGVVDPPVRVVLVHTLPHPPHDAARA